MLSVPGNRDLVTLHDLQRHAKRETSTSVRSTARGGADDGSARAQPVFNLQSATKLMARQLGLRVPPGLFGRCRHCTCGGGRATRAPTCRRAGACGMGKARARTATKTRACPA